MSIKATIVDKSNLDKALKDLAKSKILSFDTETSGLDQWAPGGYIASIGLSTGSTHYCFPLNHHQSPIYNNFPAQKLLVRKLNKVVQGKKLIAHNGKFDYLWIRVIFGFEWEIYFDTMLAHYNLDENSRHGLKDLSIEYCGADEYDIPLEEKQGRSGSLKTHCLYLAKDLSYTFQLYTRFKKELSHDHGSSTIFNKITMPISRVYSRAEFRGVYIDKSKLADAKTFWQEKRDKANNRLNELYPEMPIEFFLEQKKINGDFDKAKKAQLKGWKDKKTKTFIQGVNWSSPSQLAYILFEVEGIKANKNTPKGKPSTDESVLLQLGKDYEIPRLILEHREANKNLSTFIDGWATKLTNSRVHPNFKIHGTVTGRPSCENPNLQQTPRDPRIRSLITAPPGKVLIDVDYSQAELRIVAEESQDPALLLAYRTCKDVHSITVETIFHILASAQTKEQRKKGKAINFGFVYGMFPKKFIEYARDNYDTVFTEQEAKDIRKAFFKLYAGLEPWHTKQKKFAYRNGYVRNLLGRKRRLPDAQIDTDERFHPKKEEALRQAINSPIQSFASDLTLMSAIEIDETLGDYVEIVGSVHDSILMEASEEHLDYVCAKILDIMSNPRLLKEQGIKLSVPLEGEIEIGPWGAGKKWSQ